MRRALISLLQAFIRAIAFRSDVSGDVGAAEGGTPHLPPVFIPTEPVKLAIVVGHNWKAKGAHSKHLRQTEFDFNSEIARLIQDAAVGTPVQVAVFKRQPNSAGYMAELKLVYQQVDAWGADCSVELHFNSFNGPANGTETLHSVSPGSNALAQIVHRCMLDCFGLNNRGLVERKRFGRRGWYSMYAGKAPAILIEPGFGSHADDAAALERHWPLFVDDLIQAVLLWKKDTTK